MNKSDIYNPAFVRALFNEMSGTYGLVNLISSFGFCTIWRHQCVGQLTFSTGMTICDLMSGMGECWSSIRHRSAAEMRVIALDFSPEMCRRARDIQDKHEGLRVEVLEEDVLKNSIRTASVDRIMSTFGLKTFSAEQGRQFVFEMARILKAGGEFSLLEISVPPNRVLRLIYMFYLRRIIPLLGRAMLGNPENYRLLGVYTERFRNCLGLYEMMKELGLEVEYRSYFFGCASGLIGRKPSNTDAV